MQVTVPRGCIESGFAGIKPKTGRDRSQEPPVGTVHQASRAADNHGHANRHPQNPVAGILKALLESGRSRLPPKHSSAIDIRPRMDADAG